MTSRLSKVAVAAIVGSFLVLVALREPNNKVTQSTAIQLAGGNPTLVRSPTQFFHFYVVNEENLKSPLLLKKFLQQQCEAFNQLTCSIQFWKNVADVPNDDAKITDSHINARAGVYWFRKDTNVNTLTLEKNGKEIGEY